VLFFLSKEYLEKRKIFEKQHISQIEGESQNSLQPRPPLLSKRAREGSGYRKSFNSRR
jgi:hypothetical protein